MQTSAPQPSPTIVQTIPELDTGGAELSTIEIAEALVRVGARAVVATAGGRMVDQLAAIGAEVVHMPLASKNPAIMLANVVRLQQLAMSCNARLLHARSRAPAWSTLAVARRLGLAFVTTYHGAYGERNAIKRLYNGVMARGDRVIANSNYTADLIRARHAIPDDRLRVIHRGIDPHAFDPDSIDVGRLHQLRERWGLAPETKIALLAGRLTGWKGQRVAIAAVRRLAEQGRLGRPHEFALILAGDDQGRDGYRERLARDIAEAGLQPVVRLVGHVDDIAAAFAVAHVALVTSVEPEAFGRTAAEAQAMLCPVIATDIGAPREIVLTAPSSPVTASTGWTVPPGDVVALAETLAAALALGGADRAAIGRRARANVLGRFTLNDMKRATLAVYDELLGTDLSARFTVATR